MKIHPTTFTLEHIPRTLSPTGNITSAPKDFAVYVSAPRPGAALLTPSGNLLETSPANAGDLSILPVSLSPPLPTDL